MKPRPTTLVAALLTAAIPLGTAQVISLRDQQEPKSNTSQAKDRSHSHLSAAFNTGPRQQAKLLNGIGNAHFPITASNPLVQKFFDQGLNQLYSFMYFEAERSFRQAVMLEPENPMPYWGLALNDESKAADFIKLAVERKYRASDRERRFIEALAAKYDKGGNRDEKGRAYRAALEKIVLDYPDDVEAKLLLGQELWEAVDQGSGERTAVDALLKAVLAKNPLHPAANHFRIHLWDGPDAQAALDSCAAYPKAAPGIGHAQHMPGHIYAQLGFWERACYAMDAATRVERKYMTDSRQLPHETWNYGHNQHYLIANLGYAGRIAEGERLSQELIDTPRDPQGNGDNDFSNLGQGRMAMLRMWLRGEQWEKILADERAGWPNLPKNKYWRNFAKAIALIGLGRFDEAEKAVKQFEDDKPSGDPAKCAFAEAKGRLLVAQGKSDEGLDQLKQAAKIEEDKFVYNDPGPYPRPASEALVQALLSAKRFVDAEAAARKSLAHDPHNGFALGQLAQALFGQGKNGEAQPVVEEFKEVFANANADLRVIRELKAEGRLGRWTPRPYEPSRALNGFGPIGWQPFDMADFSLPGMDGKTFRLGDLKGRNIILVFFLGGSCDHCIQQLETFGKEKAEWDRMNVSVVAACPDSVKDLKAKFEGNSKFPFTFLSDADHRAAKLYKAWDEFENLELHATIYITPEGKVWWFRTGSTPFTNLEFLKGEIKRVDELRAAGRLPK